MEITINHYAIERLVSEWKNQRFPWAVHDTPFYHSDAFADSMRFFFMGSVIHTQFYGILDNGTTVCYKSLNAEGSIAYWRTLKANWETLYNHRLKFNTFEQIFSGLTFLPERYQDWMDTLHILKQQYSGNICGFLESCQWDISMILGRMKMEFPAYLPTHDDYSERANLFLYLAQGKFASSNLFNRIELILPYLDQILLASLIQTNVLELPAHTQLTSADIPYLRDSAQKALSQILLHWNEISDKKILPADLNTPLRNQGLVSIWRNRVPLLFA